MQSCRSMHVPTESKHFLKIILPSPIHANQMRIPEEFLKRFGDELSTDATITVPNGHVWKMKLKEYGKHVLFCGEWRNFVKYYSISCGYQLVFKYQGNSKFHVLIFDTTCAEICYPLKTRQTNKKPTLDNNRKRSEDDVNLKGHGKPRRKVSSSSHGKLVKSEYIENSYSWERANDAAAAAAANRFLPENPSVSSTIKRDRLYVAAKFARKYLKPNVAVMLQNCYGEQWEVYCICHSARNRAMMIVRGWKKFVRENNLSEGDPCVLELINKNPVVVLKVTSSGSSI